jgi:hypothetical protein
MRTACFVILISLLMASAAMAVTTYTETIYIDNFFGSSGINWVALRGVPFNPAADVVLGDIARADGRLAKLDATVGGTLLWAFDWNMILGEGYVLENGESADYVISYEGVDNGVPDSTGAKTDMWISLPGLNEGLPGYPGGAHWIGNPYDSEVDVRSIQVTNGSKTIPFFDDDSETEDAVHLGWVEQYWNYRDNASQGSMYTDPEAFDMLQPGRMYEVITHQPNLALIIPAP